MKDTLKTALAGITITVVGGFILGILLSECRMVKRMHDSVLKLEEHELKQSEKKVIDPQPNKN